MCKAWKGYRLLARLNVDDKPCRVGSSGSDGVISSCFGRLRRRNIFNYAVGKNGEQEFSLRYFPLTAPSSLQMRAAARISGDISRAFTPMRSRALSTETQCVVQPQ